MTRWISLTLLLLVLVMTTWVQRTLQESKSGLSKQGRGEPDSQMWNFTRTEMDENGLPEIRLKSRHMKHFPIDGSVEFDKPRLEVFSPEQAPSWFINAESGWLSGDRKKLILYGEVYIWRYNSADSRPPDSLESESRAVSENGDELEIGKGKSIELITTDLSILIDEEYAETGNFVTIINPRTKVTATGMQLDMKKRHLKLLNQVKGRYETPSRH